MNMGQVRFIIMAHLLLSVEASAKIPDWAARNSTKLNGSILTTVCHGSGPSLNLARTEALNACQSNASQYLKSKIKIKSMSVETEKSVGFHQEVTSEGEIDGLNCDPQRDEIDESDSQFKIWIECKFDLKKATLTNVEQIPASPNNSRLNNLESAAVKVNPDLQEKYIFVSTVPKCESLLVKGSAARTIQCNKNPLKIHVKADDVEIIVRAKGYKPKTINVKGVNANDTIQVLLDLL
jgi:hypothetical protein